MFRRNLFFALVLTLGHVQLYAAFPETFGMGPTMSATSGAGSAAVNDAFALYYNAAGMTLPGRQDADDTKSQNKLSLGFFYQSSNLVVAADRATQTSVNNFAKGSNVPSFPGMNVGVVLDLRDFLAIPRSLPVRWGFAMSMFAAGSDLAQLSILSQNSYNFLSAGSNVARPSFMTGLSVSPIKNRLSIGIAAQAMVGGTADIYLTNISLDATQAPHSDLKVNINFTPKPMAGIIYRQPIKKDMDLLTGLSYRAQASAQLDLDVTAQLPVIQPTVYALIYDQELAFFTPHTFVWGSQLRFKEMKFMLDLEYQLWSNYSLSATRQIFENAPGFKNIFVARAGFESPLDFAFMNALALNIRTGYAYVPAYTPDQTGASNYLDCDKHIVSLGFSRSFSKLFMLKKEVVFSLSLQWQHWQLRNTAKDGYYPVADGSAQPNYYYYGNIYMVQFGSTIKL